ncbi:MAG: DUF192 domain-containing protein [Dongiaceae bacterium]
MTRLAQIALLLAMVILGSTAVAQLQTFERGELTIDGASGKHRFDIELAVSAEQRAQGLMFRERLPADAGMLFVYAEDQTITMWTKNTLIPLDMIFIARDGRIVRIAERTVPGSLATVGSGEQARAVLEVNGGTAAHLGIQPGDRVIHPAFSPSE